MRFLPFVKPKNGFQFAGGGISGDSGGGGGYTLPTATASRLGGIKVGSGLSVESDGTLSASGGGGGCPPVSFTEVDTGVVYNDKHVYLQTFVGNAPGYEINVTVQAIANIDVLSANVIHFNASGVSNVNWTFEKSTGVVTVSPGSAGGNHGAFATLIYTK